MAEEKISPGWKGSVVLPTHAAAHVDPVAHMDGAPVAASAKETEKATDGWFRELKDDLIEVMLKDGDTRLRVRGKREQVYRAVELFEEWIGRRVEGEWRRPPKRGAKPIAGQESLFIDERPLDDER